jgi:hypothetical protein
MKAFVNEPVLGQSPRGEACRVFAIIAKRRRRFNARVDTRVQDAGES